MLKCNLLPLRKQSLSFISMKYNVCIHSYVCMPMHKTTGFSFLNLNDSIWKQTHFDVHTYALKSFTILGRPKTPTRIKSPPQTESYQYFSAFNLKHFIIYSAFCYVLRYAPSDLKPYSKVTRRNRIRSAY